MLKEIVREHDVEPVGQPLREQIDGVALMRRHSGCGMLAHMFRQVDCHALCGVDPIDERAVPCAEFEHPGLRRNLARQVRHQVAQNDLAALNHS